ncbi:MAG: winged helix-turn-helix transcriptional regulator [Theionarchaea archaeon]|jgi:DNA-binding HxlR family transcriptional regulator|nr:winged helix-turn-helix transcriptional regulator [Theionarchaea archaeon]
MEKQDQFIKVLGSKATRIILQFLEKEEKARYKELQQFVNTHTLNTRIKELLEFDLIQHHMIRDDTRKEWYEPTERGRKVLELLNELANMVDC